MTRGTETQETPQVPQEGRDQSEQIQEQDLETQRDQEVVAEPEAVVERERPIEESEAIEAAIVEAVEAVIEDRGPETEAREEISVLPVPIPGDPQDTSADEISVLPVPLPGQPDKASEEILDEVSYKTKPAEFTEAMDETSFKVESPAEVVEEILDDISYKTNPAEELGAATGSEGEDVLLDGSSFKVESPASEQELREGVEAEVSDEILDGADFKFFTPQPEGEIGESSIPDEDLDIRVEAEGEEVILEEGSFKPVPAHIEAGEIKGEDPTSEPVSEEGNAGNEQVEGNIEDGEEGQEDEGGSILIGEEGEDLQEVDLTTEATKEVDEYWEPPEMYIYTAEDGTKTFVDAEGNPIKCPPQFYLDTEAGSETAKAWYPGGKNIQAFDVPPFPGYKVDEFYIQESGKDIATGEPTYILVDRKGNPVENQPKYIIFDKNTEEFSYYGESESKYISAKLFSESQIFIYTAADGSKTLVDSSGNPLKCPPKLSADPEGGYSFKGPQGEIIKVEAYTSPTSDIYIYTAPDGTKTVVDSNGNLIKCPPPVYGNPEDGFSAMGSEGEKIQLAAYVPPIGEIYVYTALDGTKTVVDKDGNPVKYPPTIIADPGGEGFIAQGSSGEKIEVAAYQSPLTDIYVYTAQDGTKIVVDSNGNPIKCPPPLFNAPEDGSLTVGSEGQQVEIPDFIPSTTDIYVYTAADGTKTVVDKYGDPVKSPPHIWNDPSGEGGSVINGPDGKPLPLQEYKPISSHWDKKHIP